MNRTCDITAGREGFSPVQAKNTLKVLHAVLIRVVDAIVDALERDRQRQQLRRLDDRALRDLGWSSSEREKP